MTTTARDAPSSRARVSLLGVRVDRVDRSGAREVLDRFLAEAGPHQVVTVNIDFMRIADRDPDYRALLNGADLAVADGMPLVWLSRLAQRSIPERLAGIDLVDECCGLAISRGVGVFLLGAAPGVAPAAANELLNRHPGLRIAGTFAPDFGPPTREGDAEMVRAIQAAGRCLLFVAFGAPRQDRFIQAHLSELDVPIAMGVGCAFDILAGLVPRAPAWMQRAGLEWFWRLAQEPRRLWRRYLVEDIPFLVRLGLNVLSRGRVLSRAS